MFVQVQYVSIAKLLEYNCHSDDNNEKLIQQCSQFLHFVDCFVHRYDYYSYCLM